MAVARGRVSRFVCGFLFPMTGVSPKETFLRAVLKVRNGSDRVMQPSELNDCKGSRIVVPAGSSPVQWAVVHVADMRELMWHNVSEYRPPDIGH